MAETDGLDLFDSKGTALDRQRFTWKDMVGEPISKLDDDAFTRVRVILMNGVELESCPGGPRGSSIVRPRTTCACRTAATPR